MRALVISACLVLVGACATGGGSADPIALDGTSWRATRIAGQAVVGAAPTIAFDQAFRVSGDAGCNSFGGTYSQAGSTIGFSPLVATRRACADEARNAQETRYLATLQAAGQAQIDGDRLTLIGTAGEVAFERAG